MSHSSHSTAAAVAAAPAQGNAGAQQQQPTDIAAANSAAPASHVHQHSVQQPAAPGETDNIQPEVEEEDDLATGQSAQQVNNNSSTPVRESSSNPGEVNTPEPNHAQYSDNPMNDADYNQGAVRGSSGQTGDADMEFVSSSLPPIDDNRRQQSDKASQKAAKDAEEYQAYKAMTLEQKVKILENYVAPDMYTKGSYIDAMDTTQVYIMAKIIASSNNEVTVNFDGWSEKHDYAFKKKSYKIAPFRSQHQGYSGQTKVAIRGNQDPMTLDDLRFHILNLESIIKNDFEGKTAHYMTQYVRGHLFTFMDSIMGHTHQFQDSDSEVANGKHPFEHSLIQKLFRTYLKFAAAYFRKLKTMGKIIQELAQVPRLYLVDPQAAVVNLCQEIAETLKRLFGTEGRSIKNYILKDENQLETRAIKLICETCGDNIIPNTYGNVVQDWTHVDFIKRRSGSHDYIVEHVIQRVKSKEEIVFGTLCNYVQYFAEVGGFDALISLFRMGMDVDQEGGSGAPLQKVDSVNKIDPATIKLPFRMMNLLTQAFTHLGQVLTVEFSKIFTMSVKDQIQSRLQFMTERELKDIQKDEIQTMIHNMRDFLQISQVSRNETYQFIENTNLAFALRFLKSENLEKRLKGLADIRNMTERVQERYRFERWKQKTGKNLAHWNNAPDNKDKPYPSEVLRVGDMKQWLISNNVLQIILGANAHIEIVKRSGPLLKIMARYGENQFDESIVDLIWKCQQGKHEEMVRTVYNLIQEVLTHCNLPVVDSFFEKIKSMPPPTIDEKYVVFLREFSKMAFRKRFDFEHYTFMQENQGEEDPEFRFYRGLQDIENLNISNLTSSNANDLSAQLKSKTYDYGLSLFWQITQDDPGQGMAPLSAELHELAIQAIQDIFQQQNVKQVRSYYLFKAVENILGFKSMVQSITVIQQIIQSILIDQIEAESEEESKERGNNQPKHVINSLQTQVRLIDSLVNNIEAYHRQVKQKCKQFYQNGGSVPDKIDDHVFYGRYSHGETIQKTLDLIEFLICGVQKFVSNNPNEEMTVSMGIENIKRLWTLFVKEPNFQSDQTIFLNWINKQRTHTISHMQNYQKRNYTYEIFIFAEEEKRFMFEQFLCNPDEVDATQTSVALVKCFQKYFRMINAKEQFLNLSKSKIKVLQFEKLIGMDALWKMAFQSQNEKAKEICQELLVSLHFKFDHQIATPEHKQAVVESFVKRCMEILSKEAAPVGDNNMITTQATEENSSLDNEKRTVIQLLSLFLDRYEGIRVLKQEQSQYARMTNIKPLEIDVISSMDPENRTMYRLHISYFQTLGHLRAKIARELNLQINEFQLLIKNGTVDPDVDDDKYMKDLNGTPSKCSIKRNANYNPQQHPKYLLSKNQDNFQVIFSMLWANSPELCESVWALIAKLPKNQSVIESLKTLKFIKDVEKSSAAAGGTRDEAAISAAWSSMLDPQAIFKLLYCLQIMQYEFMNVALPQRDDDLYDDDMNQEFNIALQAYEAQRVWKQEFIQLGGFTHLLRCVVQLNLHEIRSSLELKAIRSLISIIFKFISHYKDMQALLEQESRNEDSQTVIKGLLECQAKEDLHASVLKVVKLIDAICKYSIEQEKVRGESYESIQKKIELAKLKKQRQKMMVLGNKAEKGKSIQDDDDDENEDKKLLQAISAGFKEQAEIVSHLFNMVNQIFLIDQETLMMIVNYPNLSQMLERGMILSENHNLRDNMSKRINEILLALHETSKQSAEAGVLQNSNVSEFCFTKIMEIILSTLVASSKTIKHENRSNNFYLNICKVLEILEPRDLQKLDAQILNLIQQLPQDIIERPFKEVGSSDCDLLLNGLMNVLTSLLRRFPAFKKQVGSILTHYVTHDCLFEIPHGTRNAPKCKNQLSRGTAFTLLHSLCTDNIDNLNVVLDYMKRFNQKPSWRTNKEADWSIRLYEDEKSTTGRVGIKNLGCICYMNSLNQQLFMIPGFRNDILSIKDPNHDKNPDEDNMFLQWQTLFAGLLLSQKMYVNPKSYCHAFKDWEGQPVNVLEQMDVEEYLTMFLDRLEAAIKSTPQEKTIQHHFGGTFANEVICQTCPHNYTRPEPFLSVGVPVKNKKNFQEGMEAFIAGDLLDQDNQYYCERCDKKVDALKRTCLKEMPRYLIATLKRFDFDFDLMIRKKLNDYFEFQTEIDLRAYTQDYLNQKEKQERDHEENKKNETGDADQAMDEIKMKQPAEYYQFDLVGIVVHAGTADSGHYYSYIKEQETLRQEQEGTAKWYEFNDIFVREFDPAEIPTETFGGEETNFSGGNFNNNNQKMMRMRNAYVLIYKRKLTDESLIVKDDDNQTEAAEGSSQPASSVSSVQENAAALFKLGSDELQLDADSALNKKIEWDNHRYWHIRYLFREDYQTFVTKTFLNWNTTNIIPVNVSWRNNDFHLLDPRYANFQVEQKTTLEVKATEDVPFDFSTQSSAEEINETKFKVFKFGLQFYYTILQRSSLKSGLPDMSRYLKTYINDDVRCARWFINEFINDEMLKEIMMQNCQKLMRRVYIGIMTCAMLKVYEVEKDELNFYWDDVEAGVENPRQTTLGNYMNTLLYLLPTLQKFTKNQNQFLQLIAQFCRLGIEAKRYLIRGSTMQRLLNYFYFQHTPFRDDFINAPRPNYQLTEEPEMGLPTKEQSKGKNPLAIAKERDRLGKLQSDTPPYMYLIETVASLVKCMHVNVPEGIQIEGGQPVTPYQIEDLGTRLTSNNMILFLPEASFITNLFASAQKSRAAVALSQAYVHYSFYDQENIEKLFQVVVRGLENDYDKIKPFLILFQHLLESACVPNSRLLSHYAPLWLEQFFQQVVHPQTVFYLWTEVVTDWIIKVAFRLPLMREWMQATPNLWTYLIEFFKENSEPPMPQYQDRNSSVRLTKPRMQSKQTGYRYSYPVRNRAHNFYRRHCLIQIKQGSAPDLAHEIDIDYYHLDDFKLQKDQKVQLLLDRSLQLFAPTVICTDMDELCFIRTLDKDNIQNWEATDKGRIFIEGIWETSHKAIELQRTVDIFRQKNQREAQKPNRQDHGQQQQFEQFEGMDVDDQNDDTLDEGKNAKAYAGSAGNNAQDANDEIEMLDETEQDEFQIN